MINKHEQPNWRELKMTTNKELNDLKRLGVDTQRFDINSRVDMIIKEVAD